MSSGPEAPRRPVSHRAPSGFQESARRLVPPLAAIASVVLVIVLLLVLNRPGHTSGPGPALPAPSIPPSSSAHSPSVSPSTTTTRAPSPRPTRTVPVTPPPATATAAVSKVPVTVLNNSRRTGLASRAAGQLHHGGWPIAQIGNFRGRLPVSTVYYPPGQADVAAALARQFAAVQRVRPRFSGLPGSGLTLVVTREWPA